MRLTGDGVLIDRFIEKERDEYRRNPKPAGTVCEACGHLHESEDECRDSANRKNIEMNARWLAWHASGGCGPDCLTCKINKLKAALAIIRDAAMEALQ